MKKSIFILVLLFSFSLFSQKAELAYSYFQNGEYEKAIMLYKPLHKENPIRRDYLKYLLSSYQQIEKYGIARDLLEHQFKMFPNQVYLQVEIGYNYQLQNQKDEAQIYYEKALKIVHKNPNYGYMIGQSFRQNHLLDYALESYQIAKKNNPKLNTEIVEAQIYGEKGDIKRMFNSYLDLIDKDEKYYPTIQRYIASFITNDNKNQSNILFKKLLLVRSQNNPKDAWNILLSWLFMQQHEYNKAFIQERSLFIRNPENIDRIVEIGTVAFDNNDLKTAQNVFKFIIGNNQNQETTLQAQLYLINIDRKFADSKKEFSKIEEKYQKLFQDYGINIATIKLQISYADFLSFTYDLPEKGIEVLNKALKLAGTKFQKGSIQIKLGDILVYTDQFNQALILFSRVQTDHKNSPLGQEARYKVARTSFYKGDFNWAQIQLKVLKSSTSQLIANDALNLNLLITNNISKDSVQDALKIYAKADLLAYQNNYSKAIDTLYTVLEKFKGHPIEDDALFKQAELFVKTKNYTSAESNYLKIINIGQESILMDDAYYQLAELYISNLNDPEKAKKMYEKIIFDYPSSIYLVESRKKYRKLRGDEIQ